MHAFLTVDELAEYLRVSVRVAYDLVRSGDMPAVKVGGQWRIPIDALEEWKEKELER